MSRTTKAGYKVTIDDVKNICMIIYNNHKYRKNESIATMVIKTGISREIFCKVLNILNFRHIVTRVGNTRNSKILWNHDMASPNESMYLSIHSEYYKKAQKEKKIAEKVKTESNRLSVEKCIKYLMEEGFTGRISKVSINNGIKIETSFML